MSKLAAVKLLALWATCNAADSSYGSDSGSDSSYGSSSRRRTSGTTYGSDNPSYGGDSYDAGSYGSYTVAEYHTACHDKMPGDACSLSSAYAVAFQGVCTDQVPAHEHQDGSYGSSGSSYGTGAPSYGTGAPSYGTGAPSYGDASSYGTAAPSYGGASSYGTGAPSYGDASSYGTGAPSYGGASSYGTGTPSYGDASSYGTGAPSYGAYAGASYDGAPLYCNSPATSSSKSDDGLGGGAIAGIVIAAVVGVALLGGVAVFCLKFKTSGSASASNSANQGNSLKSDVPPQMNGAAPEPTQIPGGEV